MEIREYRRSDLRRLFQYWVDVGKEIPFFFPVSAGGWQRCLLQDELDGALLFSRLHTHLATEGDQVLGFVQWGQPGFAWDELGLRVSNPPIGVVRQLFFDAGRHDVGEALLDRATGDLASFERIHAFYHILGMSCNAHHGKLHSSQAHVEQLLLARSFRVEHENAYYVLELQRSTGIENAACEFGIVPGSCEEKLELLLAGEIVGRAQIRRLERLTGGRAPDAAYLTWLGVEERHRGQGYGPVLVTALNQFLRGKGVRWLHTDTAVGNLRARKLYEGLGFQMRGTTRSYVRV